MHMLKYTITGDNVSVPERERDLIEKRFKGFEKFINEGTGHEMFITATRSTAHQREDTVRVEVRFRINSQDYFAMGEAAELMPAVDLAKEELMRVITHTKAKKQTLYHRSARKFKELIKRGRKIKK